MKTCNCTQNESHNFLDCLPKSVAWCVQNLSSRPRWKVRALWRSTGNYEACHWCGIKHDVIVGAINDVSVVAAEIEDDVMRSGYRIDARIKIFARGIYRRIFLRGISNFVFSQKDFS